MELWHTVNAQLMLVITILAIHALALAFPFSKWNQET